MTALTSCPLSYAWNYNDDYWFALNKYHAELKRWCPASDLMLQTIRFVC